MRYKYLLFLALLQMPVHLSAQQNILSLKTSDSSLQKAFDWARQTALSYKGKPGDPVGPWYESALPPRSAFCMRDAAHQSVGGEILGLSAENENMFTLFATNISAGKDWCSYWEMNRSGAPAPEDYRNDKEFWYNLNANFDVLNACWRLFLWTGNEAYISNPVFSNFHEKSVNEYIDKWILQVDSLLSRPAYPNAPVPFNIEDPFHRCRGLPSYSEGVHNLSMGIDLIAALYRGLHTYAAMLRFNGRGRLADEYEQKALEYQQHIEKYWWDETESLYHTYYTDDGVFGKGEGETFLLWFDVLKNNTRRIKTIEHLLSKKWNVENQSYFPFVFYKFGYDNAAYKSVLHLSDPATVRREYPEVSFGVIEGIVQGLMGIDADARYNRVATLYNGKKEDTVLLSHLPVLSALITVEHKRNKTVFINEGNKSVVWRATFAGKDRKIRVNGKNLKTHQLVGQNGKNLSFADIKVKAGERLEASMY